MDKFCSFKKKSFNILNESCDLIKTKSSYFIFSVLSILFLPSLIFGQCTYTFEMLDSYGDGWNGASVDIHVDGLVLGNNVTLSSGSSGTFPIDVVSGQEIWVNGLSWVSGSWNGEISWNLKDSDGSIVASGVYGGDGMTIANCSSGGGGNTSSCSGQNSPASANPYIETANSTSYQSYYYGPMYKSTNGSSYNYSRWAYLWTAAELGIPAGATITRIEFHRRSGYMGGDNEFEMYVKEQSASSISSSAWSSYTSGATKVYDCNTQDYGNYDQSGPGWFPIEFQTGYTYNGGNLVVGCLHNKINGLGNYPRWYYETGLSGKTVGRSHTTASYVENNMQSQSRRPNVRIYYQYSSNACSGYPNNGTTVLSANSGCNGNTVNLSATGISTGVGIEYQWQIKTGSQWASLIGGQSALFSYTPTQDCQFRLKTTCLVSGLSSYSSVSSTYNVLDCYLVPQTSNNTITTCTGTIYDHAHTGNYSNNCNGYTTIYPSNNGSKVQLSGNLNCENNYDFLEIYNGTTASGTPLYEGSGFQSVPAITSTHSTGALTVKFYSDNSQTGVGFDLSISCASPCSGTPTGGTSVISSATGCPNVSVDLSATGVSTESGITYQWQSSTSANGPFANGSLGTTNSISVTPYTTTYYRLRSTCLNGGGQNYTNVVSRTPAAATPGSGNSICGSGSVNLTATASGGSVQWYSAPSGGTPLTTGNSYTTPNLTQSSCYFVSSSGCPSERVPIIAGILPDPSSSAGNDAAFCDGGNTQLNGSGSTGTGSGISTYPNISTFESGSDSWIQSTNDDFNWIRDASGTGSSGTGPQSNGYNSSSNYDFGANGSVYYMYSETSSPVSSGDKAELYKDFNMKDLSAASISFSYYMYASTTNIGPGELELKANGTTIWSSTTSYNGWRTASIDLSGFCGTPTVRLSFVSTSAGYRSDNTIDDITVSGSTGNISYAWSPATGLSSTTSTNPTASPSSNTTYNLLVTAPNGCTSSSNVDITVNALPTINATPAARCDDGSVDLGAAPSSGTTVNWYTSATSSNSVGTGALFSTPVLSNTTTYYAAATSPEGCITSPRESITATINALPNVNGGPDKIGLAQCGQQLITMGASQPSGSNTGQWDYVSGPTVLFNASTNPLSTVQQLSYGGTTVVKWTVTTPPSSGSCQAEQNVQIQFTQPSTGSTYSPSVGDILWGGLTNSSWSTANNWYEYTAIGNTTFWKISSSEPSANDKVYIISNSTGGMCVSTNNNATPASNENVQDLRILDGATLNLNNGLLNVKGDITNDGNIDAGSATLKLNGNGDQTIGGTALNTTIYNLTVNKSSGDVILDQDVIVKNTFKMTSGDINNPNNLLTIEKATANALNYSSGHIKGALRRYFPNSTGSELLFPMKKGTMEREGKITFTQSPGPDQYLTVELKTGAPVMTNNYNGLPFYASDNQLIQVYSNEGYLEIDPTAGNYSSSINSAQYTLKMHAKNMSGVNNSSTIRLIKCAGNNNPNQHHTTWGPCGTHSSITYPNGSPNVNDFWVSSSSTGFSFFGFGSNNDNPLPVELVSFNGNCGDGVVELNWTTASEHNSAYYQIEKSRDGENWDVINTQDAAGNSNEMRSYSFVDAHASAGNNLYRLSQFDIDGDSKTYSVVNVNCAAANAGYFSTHPNPSTGQFHVVLNNQELIGTATIRMVDSRGTIVSQKEIEVMEGINVYNFNEFKVAPGMYYITVVNDDKSTETIKQSIK